MPLGGFIADHDPMAKAPARTPAERRVIASGLPLTLMVGGKKRPVVDVVVGYNLQRQRLLIEFELPLDAALVDVPASELLVDGADVVLRVDVAASKRLALAEALHTSAVAALKKALPAVAKTLGTTVKPMVIMSGLPRAAFSTKMTRERFLHAAAQLKERGFLAVGHGWHEDTDRIDGLSVHPAMGLGALVVGRMAAPMGNHDIEPATLEAAVDVWAKETLGSLLAVSHDTLVLQPGQAPSAAGAAAITKAWSRLTFEAETPKKAAARLLANARQGQPTAFWWD